VAPLLLVICAERGAGIVAAMYHAVFATWIASNAVDHAIFVPLHFVEQFLITGVMSVSHQVARPLPTPDVVSRNCPSRAGQFPFAGEKFLINGRAENREVLSPF